MYGGGNPFVGPSSFPVNKGDVPDTTGATWIYSPGTNTWTPGPNLNQIRSFPAGTNVGSYLVASGGYTGSTTTTSTEVLNPVPCFTPTSTPPVTATPTICIPSPTVNYTYTLQTNQTVVPGGTQVIGPCNACVGTITLPFPWYFYNTAYTQVEASTNGNLQFVAPAGNPTGANTCPLPVAGLNNTIMAYWDDMNANINDLMGVYVQTLGTAPNRHFHIRWQVGFVANDVRPSFEVILYENQHHFDTVYGTTRNGFSATVGVQEGSGSHYTQWVRPGGLTCNQNGQIQTGFRIIWTRPCP
jgi:hypothetical protein